MLSDLVFVLKRIEKILDEHKLHELYQQFATILQQVASSSTPELQEQLKDCKEDIKIVHQKIDTDDWSHSQLKIFKGFGAENVLGPKGYDRFLKALSDNSANTPGAVEEINKQKDEISQLLTKATSILTSLGELAEEKKLEEGQSVVQIVFDEDVSIETLPDLSKRASEWKT